ncbi:MAG: ornithine carbamoyltransferase [Elusimicrobiota bacterium]
MQNNLIAITDLSVKEILKLFELAYTIKSKSQRGIPYTPLKGKALAMIFHKPSTRTSVSFSVGMYQLGGLPLMFNAQDLQLRRGESYGDTARVFSRYVHGILIRTKDHDELLEFSKHASIPVINGLTDEEHPCQVLSDYFTILERKGWISSTGKVDYQELRKLKFVFLGDGSNNVANSLLLLSAMLGVTFVICSPKGYVPSAKYMAEAKSIAASTGAKISVENDVAKGVAGADALYTDVWVSMGQEDEKKKRYRDLRPYQLNSKVMSRAARGCLAMHCLPARRGEEITSEVMDGKNSIIFDQAENRLHIQKAILVKLLTQ